MGFKWVQPKEEENTRLGSNSMFCAYQLQGLAQENPHQKKKKKKGKMEKEKVPVSK